MNIVVIVIDTLRYDHVGANGNGWIHTPNLDSLAGQSWVFDRCYCASYPTIPHRTDAITGRYGAPFHPWRPLRFDVSTLPETLAQAGYATQLIHDTPHLVNGGHNFDWPFHAWTFIRGAEVDRPWLDGAPAYPDNWSPDPLFDFADGEERDKLVRQLSKTTTTYARANRRRRRDEDWNCAKLFTTAAQWLKDNVTRDRFLLWIDCFDPHEPWDVPPEFATMYDKTPGYDGRVDPRSFNVVNTDNMTEAAVERVKALYAAKVSWVDRWLGEFLAVFAESALAKNTAIILTADHGTQLAERGRFHKGYPVREQEGHVPLFIRVPTGERGRCDAIVQPQDLFATVAGLAGVEAPAELDSHDILAVARNGGKGPRDLALSGVGADQWGGGDNSRRILFTVFERDWCLQFAARRDCCRLTRYGSIEDIASDNETAVARLHEQAINALERRGADAALVDWLRRGGESDFPTECRFWDGWPGPAGYTSYFFRLCGD